VPSPPRSDLKGSEIGLVLFVLGPSVPQGDLTSIDVCLEDLILTISVEPSTHRMADRELLSATRSSLAKEPDADGCRELLTLLSTGGYGRLRRSFNTLDGFVDCYGYHSASGGWFFNGFPGGNCGWLRVILESHERRQRAATT
jgi:hypothetical protein